MNEEEREKLDVDLRAFGYDPDVIGKKGDVLARLLYERVLNDAIIKRQKAHLDMHVETEQRFQAALQAKDAEIDTLEKQVIGLTNGKLLQECIAHRGFIVELEVERDRLDTELQAERSRSEKLAEAVSKANLPCLKYYSLPGRKTCLEIKEWTPESNVWCSNCAVQYAIIAHRKPEEAGK